MAHWILYTTPLGSVKFFSQSVEVGATADVVVLDETAELDGTEVPAVADKLVEAVDREEVA